jgi:multicomponent Na+:H+ antiporter subunit G
VSVALLALLAAGLFFHLVAVLGVLRLPDFYTRLHAVSKAETVGALLVVLALLIWTGPSLLALKLVFVGLFLCFANPTSTHAIARAALRTGLEPWVRASAGPGSDRAEGA